MIKIALAALLVGQAPTYWYGLDSSGVVRGWKTGKTPPSVTEFSPCVSIQEGPSALELTRTLGPGKTERPEGIPRWRWNGSTFEPRPAVDILQDRLPFLRRAARDVCRAYRDALAELDLYGPEEIEALRQTCENAKREARP